ncbi:hypothetical protein EON65_24830 [archaeon]|nr:MAG: hypothetical protein EON65_24830 [archaeon]
MVCNDVMYMDIHTKYSGLEIAFAAIAVGLDRLHQSYGEAFTQVIGELEIDPLVVIEIMECIQGVYKV